MKQSIVLLIILSQLVPPAALCLGSRDVERYILQHTASGWFVCGEKLSEEERAAESFSIATTLTQAVAGTGINPYGILGTMAHESGFDRCALGPTPRRYGKKIGIISRSSKTISVRESELMKFISDKRTRKKFRRTGFDLGYCQVLSRFYRGRETDSISMRGGIYQCIEEMGHRSKQWKTKRPWAYWPGHFSEKYVQAVRQRLSRMGVSKEERRKI